MQPRANFDLHCHSRASDGLLSPREVVQRARAKCVDVLALTDHDDVAGLAEARATAAELGIGFVAGVEISVTWNGSTIHVVGLKVDPHDGALCNGLAGVRSNRMARARRIGAALEEVGIRDSFEGALAYALNPSLISRTHFARFLVDKGYASDVRGVFQRYLATGKPGHVAHQWASLDEACGWIRAAGGVAVLAHPGRYPLDREQLHALLAGFKRCGGAAIEVVTGNHSPQQSREFARLAKEFGFLASRGSDFHGPSESRVDLGAMPQLAQELTPVWHDWIELGAHA